MATDWLNELKLSFAISALDTTLGKYLPEVLQLLVNL